MSEELPVIEPVAEDRVWCSLRGIEVDVSVCVDSCVAPEQRPVCWMEAKVPAWHEVAEVGS